MKRKFSVQEIIGGRRVSAKALVSNVAFTFAHGVDPRTGKVTDLHNNLNGKSVKNKILFYPHGKGSTTASAWLLESVRLKNEPSAIVTSAVDPAAVIGSVMADIIYERGIPVIVWPKMKGRVKSGDQVTIDNVKKKIIITT
jgi:predicted aconitase with swiveling domain